MGRITKHSLDYVPPVKTSPASGTTPASRAASKAAPKSSGSSTTRRLPNGGSVEVPDWAVGSQYDIPATTSVDSGPLVESPPSIKPGQQAVITDQYARDKISAAQQTANYAQQAMAAQAAAKTADQQKRQQEEEARLQAEKEDQERQAKAQGDNKVVKDVQSALDEVKANIEGPQQTSPIAGYFRRGYDVFKPDGTKVADLAEAEQLGIRNMLEQIPQEGEAPVSATPAAQDEPQEEGSGYFDDEGNELPATDKVFKNQDNLIRKIADGKVKTSLDPLQAEFDRRGAQAERAWKEHNEKMDMIVNGTLPLTKSQQAIVDGLRSQFDELRDQQIAANKDYEGATKILGINTGQNRYAPDLALGNMQAAINNGVKKIAALDVNAASSIAQMEEAFRKDNFQMIDEAYNDYTAFLDKRQETIQGIQAATAAAIQAERDWNYKVQQDAIANNFKADEIDLEAQRDSIDAAYKNAQITLEQRKQLFTEQQAHISNALSQARMKLDNQLMLQNGQKIQFDENMQIENFNADQAYRQAQIGVDYAKLSLEDKKLAVEQSGGTLELNNGQVVDSSTGLPPANEPVGGNLDPLMIPGVKKLANADVVYFDPSQIADDKQKKLAMTMATRMGVQVLSPQEVKVLRSMDSALAGLDQLEADYRGLAPTSIAGKIFGDIRGRADKFFDTERGDRLQKYQTSVTNLMNTLSAISDDNNPRLTADLLARVENSLPRLDDAGWFDNPIQSNVGTGVAQINGSRQAIYNTITAYTPNAILPQSGAKIYKSTEELLKDHPELAPKAAELANLGRYTDSQIRTMLNQTL